MPNENEEEKTSPEGDSLIITLRVPDALNARIAAAAIETGLKKADVMRLALDRGIDRLLEQLAPTPQAEVKP